MADLTFRSWQRSGVYDLTTSTVDGRRRGTVELTLQNRADPSDREAAALPFRLMGPRDVGGLTAEAVVRRVPPPGTTGAEVTKCVHVELAALDLPWRHTPEAAAGDRLRPWLVLVVGTDDEIAPTAGGEVTLAPTVQAAHPLARSARWAHVDATPSRSVARLLSPRPLIPEREHVAALVPAFTDSGADRWPAAPSGQVTVPVYDMWRFSTGEAGDFVSLAARLRPRIADPGLGRAPVDYERVAPAAQLSARGALGPVGSTDAPLPADVAADVAALRAPLADPRGRPVVTLPAYGAAWVDDVSGPTWSAALNGDPRHRAAAGLGAEAAIRLQDRLASAAAAHAGALDLVAARLRHLGLGLQAARGLWRRRLPADPLHRLQVLGPTLRRVVTPSGTVHARLAAPDRPMPVALLSTAARRVLRPGVARTARLRPGATHPRAVLTAANRCPPPPPKEPKGLPHVDRTSPEFDRRAERAVESGKLEWERLLEMLAAVDLDRFSQRTGEQVRRLLRQVRAQAAQSGEAPVHALARLLALLTGEDVDEEQIQVFLEVLDPRPDVVDLLDLLADVRAPQPDRPCRPADLDGLVTRLVPAVDPTVETPSVVTRVLGTLTGLDPVDPLAPPETCPEIDLPLWRFLRDTHPDWLLPGGGQLPADAVVAVETNPAFVDAFLVGANTQLLEELRWRNIPIRAGCTPLRTFWDRIDVAAAARRPDIVEVPAWPTASSLGAPSHQPPSTSATDLVLVFRSPIFSRYPETLVYTVPAQTVGDEPDWESDPDFTTATPTYPLFQGTLGGETAFFGFDLAPAVARGQWVVLEEPPPGYRFRSTPHPDWTAERRHTFTTTEVGAQFAHAAFADPSRVLIRGDALVPEVGP